MVTKRNKQQTIRGMRHVSRMSKKEQEKFWKNPTG